MHRSRVDRFLNDARIAFDKSIINMPGPSSAFVRRVLGQVVDFGNSEYAQAAMKQLDFLPFAQSRDEAHTFEIRLRGRSHYYKQANAFRHLYNILFVSDLPVRPKFSAAHGTIRELVLLAYCNNHQVAMSIMRSRWEMGMPYIKVLEFAPTFKIHLLDPYTALQVSEEVDQGTPFVINSNTRLVLALRGMFNKVVQSRESRGFNHEYADRIFDIFLMYLASVDDQKEPGFSGRVQSLGASRYTKCIGPNRDIDREWEDVLKIVSSTPAWTRSVFDLQKLMYAMASGVARVINFIAKRDNYSAYRSSQSHSHEEVAMARDFATSAILVNKFSELQSAQQPLGATCLATPPTDIAAFARVQMHRRDTADFFTMTRLYEEQVYHYLHRSLASAELGRARAHTHSCVWVIVRGVPAECMRMIIHASMATLDMRNLVLYIGEVHDSHLGFGSVVGLRCWHDGEAAKTDAVSLFSIVLSSKTRARNFVFPGYSLPIYPFVARLLLDMPMSSDWCPAALALGTLPEFASTRFTIPYTSTRALFKTVGMLLHVHNQNPGTGTMANFARFTNDMLWNLSAPHTNHLIVLHSDMARIAKSIKKVCPSTKAGRSRAKAFFVYLNKQSVEHNERGYTTLDQWTSFLTYELTTWMAFPTSFLLAKPGDVPEGKYQSQLAAATRALTTFAECVRRIPQSAARRQSVSSGSEPGTPRQSVVGVLPYTVAGHIDSLVSPLVRRSSTPTNERGPFCSFNPDFKDNLQLPFGRLLGHMEQLSIGDSAAGQGTDVHDFDVRTVRTELVPMHQTALSMISPITSVGIPHTDVLSGGLEQNLDWCISVSTVATVLRHPHFSAELVQLQEARNNWNEYGMLEDMIEQDTKRTKPRYARPEPRKSTVESAAAAASSAAPSAPKRSTLQVQVPSTARLMTLADFSSSDDDSDDDDSRRYKMLASKPNPFLEDEHKARESQEAGSGPPVEDSHPPSPVWATPAPPSPVYETVAPPSPVNKRTSRSATRKRNASSSSAPAKAKRSKRHTRPQIRGGLAGVARVADNVMSMSLEFE